MKRVLIHVEDPGALNLLHALPAQLDARGIGVDVIADGFAAIALADSPFVRHAALTDLVAGAAFVVVGTSENRRSRALEAIALARAADIPSAGVVDLPVNAAARFSGTTDDALTFAPDSIWCVDDATVAAFRALGVSPTRLARVANPRLAALRERTRLDAAEQRTRRAQRFPAWREQPILVFAAEPASTLDAKTSHDDGTYTLTGTSGATWRTHIVLEEVLAAAALLPQRPFVVVRLHPKNARADVAFYQNAIDAIDENGDPIDVLVLADAVVGMTSMILQEAIALGIPTLSVIPRASERAWLPMLADGTIPTVTTRSALRVELPRLLSSRARSVPSDDAPTLLASIVQKLDGVDGIPFMSC